jgi:hypothetical protein
MRIGLLSDTHGYVDPALWDLFKGVDLLLHAGDVGSQDVLVELETIAPVIAVHGNSDFYPVSSHLPGYRIIKKEGKILYLTHILGHKKDFIFRLRRDRIHITPDIVVFGHLHKPSADMYHDILFINPGVAGKQRTKGVRSVAILEINADRRIHYQFRELK